MFLRREKVRRPLPFLANRVMRDETREALDDIGVNIPRLNAPVARLSGGQRQAIAVARTVHSEADILLLDEPLAAMGAKEGALILDLIAAPQGGGPRSRSSWSCTTTSTCWPTCDRVNLIQDGVIALDKPTSETSVEELTEIVVDEYRRARAAAQSRAEAEPWPVADVRDRRRLRHAVGRAPWSCASTTAPSSARPCTTTPTG